jgi:hypothetical protein
VLGFVAVDRLHGVVLSGQDRTCLGGLDPGGGNDRRLKLRRRRLVTDVQFKKPVAARDRLLRIQLVVQRPAGADSAPFW